jgi:thiamine-monophosphate kinase
MDARESRAVTRRGEFDLIRAIRAATPAGGAGVLAGIGDDCAVLRTDPADDLLLKTDMLVEDVHFRIAGTRPEDVGWKALAVNVSDIAAMGGRPLHAVLSLALRPELTGEFADGLVRGLLECAARYGVALVGGDTNSTAGPAVVNVALTGRVPRGRAVLRSGARPGDAICVTGALGGSLAGRHLRVTPRVEEAAALVAGGVVHAMIDVSDGLSSDLGHVLDASGAGAEVFADRVPVHDDAVAMSRADGRPPLRHALDDGEDFELLFTVAPERAPELVARGLAGTRVSHVGTITAGRQFVLVGADGARTAIGRGGYDHFAAR